MKRIYCIKELRKMKLFRTRHNGYFTKRITVIGKEESKRIIKINL